MGLTPFLALICCLSVFIKRYRDNNMQPKIPSVIIQPDPATLNSRFNTEVRHRNFVSLGKQSCLAVCYCLVLLPTLLMGANVLKPTANIFVIQYHNPIIVGTFLFPILFYHWNPRARQFLLDTLREFTF
jgi:hypothetical protein